MAAVGAITLDGKATRDEIFVDLKERVAALTAAGHTPGLGTVLVGDDPGSHAYVRGKHADCAKVGINSIRRDLPADISQAKLDETIDELNANPECTGYIVQLPLPKHLNENAALERVDPGKDADGLHPTNLGRLVLNEPAPLPCTPRGIVHLLRRYEVEIAGAQVVVIGRGVTVGRPLGLLLTRRSENATVTLCHTATRHLPQLTREADIIIAAAGVPHMVTAEMVRPGAAVVDVGVSRDDAGKLVGDVHPDVWEVAGHVSPNPGGVGPLTRAFLLTNVVERAEASRARDAEGVRPQGFRRAVADTAGRPDHRGGVRPGGRRLLATRRAGARHRRRRRCGVSAGAARGPGRPAGGAQQDRRFRHHRDGQRGHDLHRMDDRPVRHQLSRGAKSAAHCAADRSRGSAIGLTLLSRSQFRIVARGICRLRICAIP